MRTFIVVFIISIITSIFWNSEFKIRLKEGIKSKVKIEPELIINKHESKTDTLYVYRFQIQ